MTNETDIVYDPFAGVGSSLIAALKNNRRAYGTELEQSYVDIGLGRIQKLADDSLPIRPIYQKIWTPKPTDKIVRIPDEWRQAE